MPVQIVTARRLAMQYDGTNSAAVLAFCAANVNCGNATWSIAGEVDGVLSLVTSDPDLWGGVDLNTDDYLISPNGEPCPPGLYADRFTILGTP